MHPVLRNLVKSIQYEPLFHSETSKFCFFCFFVFTIQTFVCLNGSTSILFWLKSAD